MPQSHSAKQNTGRLAENIAFLWLQTMGFHILDRNVFTRSGEIDIIAEKSGALHFIEVRMRKNSKWGKAIESLSHKKIRNLKQAAHHLIENNPDWHNRKIKFSLVGIDGDESSRSLEFLEDAF